jgi:hypothetical protein
MGILLNDFIQIQVPKEKETFTGNGLKIMLLRITPKLFELDLVGIHPTLHMNSSADNEENYWKDMQYCNQRVV